MANVNVSLFGLFSPRRYCWLISILLVILICFSVSWSVVYPWLAILLILFMVLVVDCLFLGDEHFRYDPEPKNWTRATEPKY